MSVRSWTKMAVRGMLAVVLAICLQSVSMANNLFLSLNRGETYEAGLVADQLTTTADQLSEQEIAKADRLAMTMTVEDVRDILWQLWQAKAE